MGGGGGVRGWVWSLWRGVWVECVLSGVCVRGDGSDDSCYGGSFILLDDDNGDALYLLFRCYCCCGGVLKVLVVWL